MKINSPLSRQILATSIAVLVMNSDHGHGAAWVGDVDGNWNEPTRWTGGIPNATGAIADASTVDITAPRTITMDGSFTTGTLRFGDATTLDNDWFLLPPAGNTTNTLTLDVASGVPVLEVVNRNATVEVTLAGTDGLSKIGAGTAFLTGTNTYTGNTAITAGALILGNGGGAGSLQSTQVSNTVGVGNNLPGGLEIRRSDTYTLPFTVTNPTNNQGSGSLTINTGTYDNPTSGATINKLVRQANLHVGRTANFGRLFIEAGADIAVGNLWVGEQSGRTGQVIQNGGTALVTAQMRIGHWPQVDPLTLIGNTTTPSTHTMNAGTLTFSGSFTGNPQGTGEKNGILYLGIDSTGELIVNGGTVDAKAIVLDNRTSTAGTDRLVINGGTVRVGGIGNGTDADLANVGSAIISNNAATTYNITYTGGTLQASGNFLHAADAVLESTNGNIAVDSNGNLITVSGVFSGAGGLRKTGAGTLLVKSNSTYEGSTEVNGGVFSLTGSLASSVNVNSGGTASASGNGTTTGTYGSVTISAGGTLSPGTFGTTGSIGTLGAGSLTTSGDARFDLSSTNTTIGGGVNDLVVVNGPLTFGAGSTITPVFTTTPLSGSTYTLFTSTGRTGAPTLSTQSASRQTFTIDTTTQPNNVLLSISGSAASMNLTWKGNGTTNTWDVNNSVNWNNNTEKFFQLDATNFDDTGSSTPQVNLVGLLQPVAVNVGGTKDYTFGGTGTISGPGGLTKSGTGVLTITSGAHDFSGAVNLAGTTIITALRGAGQASSLGAGNAIGFDGTLRYTGNTTTTNRAITLNGAGGAFDITDAAATVSVTSALAGAGKLTKTGGGSLVLPASNTYTGGTDLLAGLLRLSSNNKALGDAFAVRIDNGATLDVNGVTGAASTRRYDVTVGPAGARILNLGAGATNDPIYRSLTLEGGLIIETSSRYDLNGGAVDGNGVTVNGNGFPITKRGTGETWWAPAAGATIGDIIVDAGTFGVQSSFNLGDDTRSIIVNPAGQLLTYSAVTNTKPIILSGGLLAPNNASATWMGSITLNGAATSNRIGVVAAGTGITLSGKVTGPGGFEKVNGGTLTLENATNDWVGNTLISGGTVIATAEGSLPTTTTLLMNGGALDLPSGSHTVAGLSGATGTIQGSGTLIVNQSETTSFGGTIADPASLTKSGTGTLTLSGASPSTGNATVSAGTLLVNGSIVGTTVVDGGTLRGTGAVGPLFLNALGTVAPGVTAGTLSAGNTVFNGGTFALELNGPAVGSGYDQLNITGTFNLSSNTPLSINLGYNPNDFVDSFVIVNNDDTEAISRTGLFTFNTQPLAEGALFTVGSQPFRISYVGGANANDIVLSAVPEPGSLVTLLGGVGALLGLQRLRRRGV
ncbi:MAG: transporter [Chthoniobacter sp.]|nr:transporter [Chthoniobacter sp.]